MAYDLLIKDGRIIDGSGGPSFSGDVAIKDGKIVDMGKLSGTATQTVHADGQAVAPGFIDIHTHMDAQLTWDPLATSSCWHGITTVVTGNCSFAIAPCKPEDREHVLRTLVRVEGMSLNALQAGIVWNWVTIPEYLAALDRRLGLNVAVFMGHSAIRQFVMGPQASERAAQPEEIERMRVLVQEGMAAGAFGITFNHNPSHVGADGRPVPSRLSTEEEMLSLVKVLAGYDRGAVQIIGYPSQGIVNSAQEGYLGMAQAAGRPIMWLGILHQWQRPQAWRAALAKAEKIREDGLPVYPMCTPRTIDVLFTLTNAHIFDGFPAWKDVLTKSPAEVTAALQRSEVRAALRQNLQDAKLPGTFSRRWDLVHVESTKRAENKRWEGQTVEAMARAQGKDPLDAFCDLALHEDLATEFTTVLANGDEGAVGEILQSPATVIWLSDAGAHAALECGYGFTTYLLGYCVREKKVLPLEEAVRKLTSMPAAVLGLKDRGYVRPGLAADLVVFDPDTVAALPPVVTYDLPAGEKRLVQKAAGIACTVVNGQMLTEQGEHTGGYPGRVLRS